MSPQKTPANKVTNKKILSASEELFFVGIGASAGGLEACELFFDAMPADADMGFIVVVHLDPTHASLMPELLQKHTSMPVHQAKDAMKVLKNCVYVIPPNCNLSILNGILYLTERNEVRRTNLPIDSFFRSLAQDQAPRAVGIILSGTGSDGTLGLKAIKGEQGMVMVQSEDSAKYDGMPHSAIGSGLADFILPPQEMPGQLMKYSKKIFPPRLSSQQSNTLNVLQKIFILLRNKTDQDFSLYKHNTICRRIERRMNLHQLEGINDYLSYLQANEQEIEILFKELLIGVTNFFRDPEAFSVLKSIALPKLLKEKPEGYTLRVWVAGCSSGEEAYSIAILLQECMEDIGRHFPVQIFGTDLDDNAIDSARSALYPPSIVSDVSPARLKRYFNKEDDGNFRIKKNIREMLVFAPQNIIKDPPFTKLDILCCRNLLIYLGSELQNRLLPLFHYSLKPGGVLFLGSSESLGQSTDIFTPIDKKWKIYEHNTSSARSILDLPRSTITSTPTNEIDAIKAIKQTEELSSLQLVSTILNELETPASIIIDRNHNIVYIHGKTGRYLEPAEGKACVNILEMARPSLKAELTIAIHKASTQKQEYVLKALHLQYNNTNILLNLTVKPVLEHSNIQGLMMVIFQEIAESPSEKPEKSRKKNTEAQTDNEEVLKKELRYTKESLQTTIEELETSNEELKSTNEELQSTNEELQSTNEEMETSKEELQSLNEESTTVNAELQSRIDELSETNDDMKNLLDSTDIATVFLDINLCVRRFTPRTTSIIPLTATDSGRPIGHFATNLIDVNLERTAQRVLDNLSIQESEVWCKKIMLTTCAYVPIAP